MFEVTTVHYVLMGFMIVASLVAIETADLLGSVICVGAVGFALSALNLLLGAPDLALALEVVDVLTFVVLIRVVRTRRDTYHATSRDTLGIAAVIAGLSVLLVITSLSLADLPVFGEPVLRMTKGYLEAGLQSNAAVNYVTSIVFDFRGYDTLGEATVIFASIIGAFAVLRRVGRKHEA